MAKLILIEGLPGTGKSTLARTLAAELRAQGESVDCYIEGDLHPVDLQWIARMTDAQWRDAIETLRAAWERSPQSEPFESIEQRLVDLTEVRDGLRHVAWTKVAFADIDLWNSVAPFKAAEVNDGRASLDDYQRIYRQRWQQFGESAASQPGTVIFECAFLQSHVTELLGYHLCDEETTLAFLQDLIDAVADLRPEIRYLAADDYRSAILSTADARGGETGWIREVIEWVERSPYGRAHGLTGLDGALAFFQERARIERAALERLGVPVTIIARRVRAHDDAPGDE